MLLVKRAKRLPRSRRILLVLAVLGVLLAAVPAWGDKRVLLVNSYHRGHQWTDDITDAVLTRIGESSSARVFVEYLDTKRTPFTETSAQTYFDLLARKHRVHRFDLVITSDNDAFDLMVGNPSLMPAVPVVFCGLNGYDAMSFDHFAATRPVTGIVENLRHGLTLNAALKLHPDTERIVIVGDETLTGRLIQDEVAAKAVEIAGAGEVLFAPNTTIEETRQFLKDLPANSLVYLTVYNRDQAGQNFELVESARYLLTGLSVPAYSSWDFYVGTGVLGGFVTSGTVHGDVAAQMANTILNSGTDAMPSIEWNEFGRYVFDYRQMQRFGVAGQKLPPHSDIRFDPLEPLEDRKRDIIIAAVILGLLIVALVMALSIARLRGRVTRQLRLRQEQLVRNKAQLRQILDAVPLMIYAKDEEGRFLMANRAAAAMYGTAPAMLIGRTMEELHGGLTEADLRRDRTDDGEVLHGIAVYGREEPFRKPDGSLAYLRVSKVPVDLFGGRKILGVAEEITELRQTRSELEALNVQLEDRVRRRTEELEHSLDQLKQTRDRLVESEKLASLGQLVAGIAHELNTPLGISVTAATYLQSAVASILTDFERQSLTRTRLEQHLTASRTAVESIVGNLQKSAELVSQFKRVSADATQDQIDSFDLGDLIQGILTSTAPLFNRRYVQIEMNCPEEVAMESYPGALVQVLTNLIDNSLIHGFAPDESGNIAVDVLSEDETVVIDYRDDGHGMDAETARHSFEPFYTTARDRGGTGLGLHIVHTLVTGRLQGQIMRETAPGQGVLFRIVLPKTVDQSEEVSGTASG